MDRLLLTQLLIVFSLIGFSQNKIPSDQLMFRNEVLKHPHLNPFLKADLVNQTGNKTLTIKVKSKNNIPGAKNSSTSNYQEITGNASDIFQVIRSVHPEEIIYDPRVGQVLNDEVLDHINASEVHSGTGVAQSKGKGVIMGIIDTGIELAHPDFQDSLGNSRVIGYWNQDDVSNPGKAPSKFGYGSEWSANEINSGQAVVKADHHGTHVAGIAAGNGLATGTHLGVAPESDIVFVQWFTNGGRDWKGTVADAVQYIFDFADSQGKPCVINISLGAYWGPHDGRDPAALRIDSMLDAKPGRAVICAAGNSGAGYNYHVRHDVVGDTAFSWFEFIQAAGYDLDLSGVADSGVFFESWSDTADYKNLKFSFGADDLTGTGKYRGSTSFKTFNPGWNYDTLYSLSGNRLATVQVFLQLQGDRYWMFVGMPSPDSAQYTYRLTSAGSGKLDIWSCPSFTSSSRMIMDDSMKAIVSYPGIDHLVIPDSNYKIVDSWACSPKVITVGNYVNKSTYVDFAGQVQTFPETVGEIFVSSSSGPTRDDRIKPDVSAPGTRVFAAATMFSVANDTILNPHTMAPGGFHKVNTGTSMASPAVAGIAALYFENCMNAQNDNFVDALRNTARTDSLTGLVPNVYYGYGKADALSLLNTSIPKPQLDIEDTSVCQSVVVSTTSIYQSYQWSNGSINSFVSAASSGTYFAMVDSAGCSAVSDSVNVTIDPFVLPAVNVTAIDPTVFCEGGQCELMGANGYQTYTWSGGLGSSQNVIVSNTGFYYYVAGDANGCLARSDSILIVSNMSPPKPNVVSQEGLLGSDVVANSYNWYLDGSLIGGQNNQSLSPPQNGYYQVEVIHANGCSSISDSLLYNNTGLLEMSLGNITVYPNPSIDGRFFLNLKDQSVDNLRLTNALGQLIYEEQNVDSEILEIDLKDQGKGLYILNIEKLSVGNQKIKLLIP